jgi:hypothetical protein
MELEFLSSCIEILAFSRRVGAIYHDCMGPHHHDCIGPHVNMMVMHDLFNWQKKECKEGGAS